MFLDSQAGDRGSGAGRGRASPRGSLMERVTGAGGSAARPPLPILPTGSTSAGCSPSRTPLPRRSRFFFRLLAEPRVLVEDVPGVGKTVLAKALARTLDLRFSRLQFTPDPPPSDVTGVNVYDQQEGAFRFRPGPAPPNASCSSTRSTEPLPRPSRRASRRCRRHRSRLTRETYPLERPFLAIATQNPVEYAGYLPAAERRSRPVWFQALD